MKSEFTRSFARDLRRVRDRPLLLRVQQVIEEVEAASSSLDIAQLKKLAGHESFYRIRLGDYRIGLMIDQDVVVFVRFLHRKDLYRYFP